MPNSPFIIYLSNTSQQGSFIQTQKAMARSSIIFCLVILSVAAMAAAKTPAPKQKDPGHIIVQGTILCQQGNKPILGATANLTCEGIASGKPSTKVTTISNPTNAKGVYVIGIPATLPTGEKLIHCRVTLKSSPVKTCNVPTNVNGGIKGFGLTKVLFTTNPHDKLFIVPNQFYTNK